ncbi:hypothetical protein ABK040_011142 [Willaertia magna]
MKYYSTILGIGIDTVSIQRFHKLINKRGEKFIHRLFHPKEIESCPVSFSLAFSSNKEQPLNSDNKSIDEVDPLQWRISQYYASRWAAKEATLKALGFGGIGSKEMYVYKTKHSNNEESIINEGDNELNTNNLTKLYPPKMKLEGKQINAILQNIIKERNADDYKVYLSISHDSDMAIANVLIEAIHHLE